MATTDQSTDFDAIIVGAGFSGLYMLHKMRDQLGMRARVFEAGDGVGGTWYWNRYPGARCDSESYYYSFSFSSELEQEWEWTSKYPEQPEILRYLNHVADRFDLRDDISLSTRIVGAAFDDASDTWTVTTEGGDSYTSRFFITAVGCLSTANVPNFRGLESFRGDWYHTGAWPHEGVDFTGKRVGLIGTGSTGIQATPVIAAQAAHLTVFQRTPNYTIPARNAPLTPERAAEIKANYGEIRELARNSFGGFPYPRTDRSAKDVEEAERTQIYEDLWNEGGFKFLYGSFGDLLIDEESNETAAEFIRNKIRQIVKDPATAELLCPTDHPYGSKRPPIDTNYFETFNRDNVTLVDVRSDPIEEITPTGLRTVKAEYEPRRHRVRHRLRRHDGLAAAAQHHRQRWGAPGRHLGGRTPQLPGPAGRGIPEHVHHHRTGQPVGAQQHAGLDRATRGLDRGLHRAHALQRPHQGRGHRAGPGRVGGARGDDRQVHPVRQGELLVPGRQHPGQDPGVHALRRGRGHLPRPLQRDRGQRLRGLRLLRPRAGDRLSRQPAANGGPETRTGPGPY